MAILMGSDHCPVFTDCDMSDEDDDEDEDENEDGNKTSVDLIEQPKLSFEAKIISKSIKLETLQVSLEVKDKTTIKQTGH